jgi:chemotaxis protein CheX
MDVGIINPFVESTLEVASTMAQLDFQVGKPSLKTDSKSQGEVTGFIELSGMNHKGSLAISFNTEALLLVYQKMLGEVLETVDDSALDLAGEITNMVCGGAKQKLSEQGFEFDLTQPSILSGHDHEVVHTLSGPVLSLPLQLEQGIIYIEVSLNR